MSTSTGRGAASSLPEAQRKPLKCAPARRNLAGIGHGCCTSQPEVERQNAEVERVRQIFRTRSLTGPPAR